MQVQEILDKLRSEHADRFLALPSPPEIGDVEYWLGYDTALDDFQRLLDKLKEKEHASVHPR